MSPTRRDFLRTAAAAGLAGGVCPPVAPAIDPIKRPSGKPDLKLSLAAYSFRQFLGGKTASMTLFDFIDYGATLPLDAVELTSYYFPENPTDEYLDKLKAHAAAKKLAISGVPIRSDFAQKDDAKRRKDVEHTKLWTRRAAKLGATTVRIFAGAVPKGDTLEAAQKRVVESVAECCKEAEKLGVYLAVENHHGVTETPEQLLALVKPINSPALGVNIDTGNFHTPDPYADVAKIAPYGVVAQVKTEVYPNNKREPADLARVVKILKDANFHWYVALEYEAAEDPKVAVPRHVKELRKLIG
jgi:sugar phosphate isomerase/epimerase